MIVARFRRAEQFGLIFPSDEPIVNQMPKKIKKYLITTEEHEIFTVRSEQEKMFGFCSECRAEVEFVNLDSAVGLTKIRTREIFRLAEKGEIHSLETESGHLLICKDSLTEFRTQR